MSHWNGRRPEFLQPRQSPPAERVAPCRNAWEQNTLTNKQRKQNTLTNKQTSRENIQQWCNISSIESSDEMNSAEQVGTYWPSKQHRSQRVLPTAETHEQQIGTYWQSAHLGTWNRCKKSQTANNRSLPLRGCTTHPFSLALLWLKISFVSELRIFFSKFNIWRKVFSHLKQGLCLLGDVLVELPIASHSVPFWISRVQCISLEYLFILECLFFFNN